MGTLDEATYRGMLDALKAQVSPTTPPDLRAQSFADLETFKQREEVVEYAVFILSRSDMPEHDDFTRHFALQCLETAAKSFGGESSPVPSD